MIGINILVGIVAVDDVVSFCDFVDGGVMWCL